MTTDTFSAGDELAMLGDFFTLKDVDIVDEDSELAMLGGFLTLRDVDLSDEFAEMNVLPECKRPAASTSSCLMIPALMPAALPSSQVLDEDEQARDDTRSQRSRSIAASFTSLQCYEEQQDNDRELPESSELALLGDFLTLKDAGIMDEIALLDCSRPLEVVPARQAPTKSQRPVYTARSSACTSSDRVSVYRKSHDHEDPLVVARETVLTLVGDGAQPIRAGPRRTDSDNNRNDGSPCRNKRVTILVVRRDRRNNSMGIGCKEEEEGRIDLGRY